MYMKTLYIGPTKSFYLKRRVAIEATLNFICIYVHMYLCMYVHRHFNLSLCLSSRVGHKECSLDTFMNEGAKQTRQVVCVCVWIVSFGCVLYHLAFWLLVYLFDWRQTSRRNRIRVNVYRSSSFIW